MKTKQQPSLTDMLRDGPYIRNGRDTIAVMMEAADEIERLRAEVGRLFDSREAEWNRLDWLMSRMPGNVIRDVVGVMNDTGDVAEWRELIDKAAAENNMEHFNRLTPAEAERLALLSEECGEVVQAIGKVLRHGFESTHPDGGPTNRESLERECGDVYHAIWRLIGAGDIDGNGMSQRADDKAKSIVRCLHHQGHNAGDHAPRSGRVD